MLHLQEKIEEICNIHVGGHDVDCIRWPGEEEEAEDVDISTYSDHSGSGESHGGDTCKESIVVRLLCLLICGYS